MLLQSFVGPWATRAPNGLNKTFNILLFFCTELNREPFHSLFCLHLFCLLYSSFSEVPDTVVGFVCCCCIFVVLIQRKFLPSTDFLIVHISVGYIGHHFYFFDAFSLIYVFSSFTFFSVMLFTFTPHACLLRSFSQIIHVDLCPSSIKKFQSTIIFYNDSTYLLGQLLTDTFKQFCNAQEKCT